MEVVPFVAANLLIAAGEQVPPAVAIEGLYVRTDFPQTAIAERFVQQEQFRLGAVAFPKTRLVGNDGAARGVPVRPPDVVQTSVADVAVAGQDTFLVVLMEQNGEDDISGSTRQTVVPRELRLKRYRRAQDDAVHYFWIVGPFHKERDVVSAHCAK